MIFCSICGRSGVPWSQELGTAQPSEASGGARMLDICCHMLIYVLYTSCILVHQATLAMFMKGHPQSKGEVFPNSISILHGIMSLFSR